MTSEDPAVSAPLTGVDGSGRSGLGCGTKPGIGSAGAKCIGAGASS